MTLRAILFDKDGTLVDFLTWSAATFSVMQRMSGGDPAKLARLVEVNDYDLEQGRIRPTSVLVAGSSADYGLAWAEAWVRSAILSSSPIWTVFSRRKACCTCRRSAIRPGCCRR